MFRNRTESGDTTATSATISSRDGRADKDECTSNELVAEGVSIILADGRRTVARVSNGGEVLLTCGALGNPAVLQRSGAELAPY